MSLKKSHLIYDIGLHRGEDTEFYLAKGFDVVAFEADPELAERCRRRFAVPIRAGRLTIVEGAIVEPVTHGAASTVPFYRNTEDTVWGTVLPEWAARNARLGSQSNVIEVRAVNMGDCLKLFGIPYYMKIDIEGADVFCLRALLESPVRPDYVSIEAEKRSFGRLKEEFQLLERLGYSVFKVVQQADLSRQQPPQPALEGDYRRHEFAEGASGLFGRELPGRWCSRRQALLRYRWIFLLYRLFGDYGILRTSWVGRRFRWGLAALLRQPIPGWYDTHARHSSVEAKGERRRSDGRVGRHAAQIPERV